MVDNPVDGSHQAYMGKEVIPSTMRPHPDYLKNGCTLCRWQQSQGIRHFKCSSGITRLWAEDLAKMLG